MAYSPETEIFYQDQSTIVDSTPDGDTVKEGFDDRLTPALAAVYSDLNLLKTAGMIGMAVGATETTRGIGRIATEAEASAKKTGANGPAFLTPEHMPDGAKLNNTVTSTSTTEGATANAVKQAYDKAVSAANTASSAASTASSAAPKPSSSGGTGQWVFVYSASALSFRIPSGGTWAYFAVCGEDPGYVYGSGAGVASGGTTINFGFAGSAGGFCWRIS